MTLDHPFPARTTMEKEEVASGPGSEVTEAMRRGQADGRGGGGLVSPPTGTNI